MLAGLEKDMDVIFHQHPGEDRAFLFFDLMR